MRAYQMRGVSFVTNKSTAGRPELRRPANLWHRGIAVALGAVALAFLLGAVGPRPRPRPHPQPGTRAALYSGTVAISSIARLTPALDTISDRDVAAQELSRARALIQYSTRYNIPADLAALIYDTAQDEGVDPELAYRLVYVESRFNPRAKSSAGALGLAQLLPGTARFYERNLEPEDLYDRQLNLRIGFRYLTDLLDQFDGDLPLALIAYNRGPKRLRDLLDGGVIPWNGYASAVLNGYAAPDGTTWPADAFTAARGASLQ
jgi:soluble lytic murein transglycosylase-like protein